MACFDLASGPKKRPQRGGRAHQKIDRTGRPSITKTERPRSANLPQMPRGLMCKLRRRGPDYGGPAGSRGIDPSLQPLPFAAIAGAVLYGRAASRRPSHAFRLNPNSGPVCPACDIGVALFGGLFCIWEWPNSASTRRRCLPVDVSLPTWQRPRRRQSFDFGPP